MPGRARLEPELTRVAAQRLGAQQLARHQFDDPAALVGWMGAIQAQDPAGARWAVGIRLAGRTVREEDVLGALEAGSIIRTHVMRWTWQLVAAADLHWLLPLVAPVLVRRAARRFRELDLDERTFRRSWDVLQRALRDGPHRTRDELRAALQAAKISVQDGRRLSYLLGRAELEGIICSGSPRGKAATYALVTARAPRPASPWPRERALAELARRYFRSRGPATLADFVAWSGLPPADARAALQSVAGELTCETAAGRDSWRHAQAGPAPRGALTGAYLLPPFEEILIAYKDRQAMLDPAHASHLNAGGGMLGPPVLLAGRVVGVWGRTLARDSVAIAIRPLDPLAPGDRAAVTAAAERYARFLQLKPAIDFR